MGCDFKMGVINKFENCGTKILLKKETDDEGLFDLF